MYYALCYSTIKHTIKLDITYHITVIIKSNKSPATKTI